MSRRVAIILALMLLEAAASGAARYVGFGDSITYGEAGRSTDAYLGPLAEFLRAEVGAAEMINEGVNGSTSADALARVGEVTSRWRPDWLLIMYGTNDVRRWVTMPGVISPAGTEANLREVVRQARAAGARMVMATVVPRVGGRIDPSNTLTRRVNDIIRRVAQDEGAVLAEVFANVEPFASSVTYLDDTHPNRLGDRLIAEAMAAALSGRPVTGIDLTPPLPFLIEPAPFSRGNPLVARVRIGVSERKSPIDTAQARLGIDGVLVTPDVEVIGGEATFTYDFPERLDFGRTVSVSFRVADTAPRPNEIVLEHTFSVLPGNGTRGDADRSGRVDGADLALLAAAFGAGIGEDRYRFEADFDGSGFVDGLDLLILAEVFGEPS